MNNFYLLYRNFKIAIIIIAVLLKVDSIKAQEPEAIHRDIELSKEQKIERAKEYYLRGKEFIQQGDYIAADNEFKKAQLLLESVRLGVSDKISLQTPEVKKEEADAEIKESPKNEEPKDIISYYLEAIKLEPKNTTLHYNLALEYLKRNEFKQAKEAFKRVIELDSRDKDAYYNLGVLYDSYFNDKEKAIHYYSRYIRLAPRAEDAEKVRAWIKQLREEISK